MLKMGWLCLFLCLEWFGWNGLLETTCDSIDEQIVCYGSDRRGEDWDWVLEISGMSGSKTRFTESRPYDQEARYVAVSKEGSIFLVVVHSRWIEEFSTRMEFKWELLLIEPSGVVSKRTDLPGKPEGTVELFGRISFFYPDSTVWTFDSTFAKTKGMPNELVVSMDDIRTETVPIRWFTPSGEEDVPDGIGHYVAIWSDGGHSLSLEVDVVPTIEGIADRAIYSETIVWRSDASIEIDGATAGLGGRIDSVGHHTLVARGKNGFLWTWTFTIEPTLHGFPASPTASSVRLYSNASIQVDDAPYRDGTPIERAGTYEIALIGTGGYVQKLSLTILSSAIGVIDGGAYDAPHSFVVNGTARLNGTAVSGRVELIVPGEYELAFLEDGSPPRFVFFTVLGSAEDNRSFPWLSAVQIGLAAIGLLGLYFVRKRK